MGKNGKISHLHGVYILMRGKRQHTDIHTHI